MAELSSDSSLSLSVNAIRSSSSVLPSVSLRVRQSSTSSTSALPSLSVNAMRSSSSALPPVSFRVRRSSTSAMRSSSLSLSDRLMSWMSESSRRQILSATLPLPRLAFPKTGRGMREFRCNFLDLERNLLLSLYSSSKISNFLSKGKTQNLDTTSNL